MKFFKFCYFFIPGMRHPPAPAGPAGGDPGGGLQDDIRGRRCKPATAAASCHRD